MGAAEIIESMLEVVSPGARPPAERSLRRLERLTQALVAARPAAAEEHARFLSIRQRELCLPREAIAAWLEGANILVTGGTGCIGSRLMALAAGFRPRALVSVSRGITTGWPAVRGADYRFADIRDRRAMDHLIGEVRPDVVFHVAAQRQPALAETEVHRSVSTNVLGTRNVLLSAAEAGVSRVVYASTGKALRPYSPEIYAASKRAAEWVASGVAASGEMMCSAARFTHVSDNSIIYSRLLSWAEGGVIRLHGPHIAFYVQSALESAQLLLLAGLGTERHRLRVHAINNLDWPVNLLDVALGVLSSTGSSTPIHFSGYDPGYEEVSFPVLYDPKTSGELSPLLNAFEAAAAVPPPCPMLDTFRLEAAPDPRADKLLDALEEVCAQTADPDAVRGALDDLSWALLDATLSAAPREALTRAAMAAERHDRALAGGHRRLLQALKYHAATARMPSSGGLPPYMALYLLVSELKVEADPAEVGFDPDRLRRIDEHFARYVDDGRLSGWLITVSRRGRLAHVSCYGSRDREAGLPVEPDTLWRIYSMTKPITSVAAMMLYEQGAFELTDPVAAFIPSFADVRVYAGGSDLRPVTAPATEPVRIWHLLTHTAGLTYGFHRVHPSDAMYRSAGFDVGLPPVTLEAACDIWAGIPLLFQPGAEWNYSVATDVLGRVVEVASGQSLDEFFRSRIFGPLGMTDTGFYAPQQELPRLAALYTLASGRKAARLDALGEAARKPPVMLSGGGGLVSTAADYHRFTQMLLRSPDSPAGEFNGTRLLSPRTVAYMGTNHLPGGADLQAFGRPLYAEVPFRGMGFGLGFGVVIDPVPGKVVCSPGELTWGGAASTAFFIDPAEELTVSFFTQLIPSNAHPIRSQLRQMVYQALT